MKKNFTLIGLLTVFILILTACSAIRLPLLDKPDHVIGRYYRMPKLDVAGLNEQQQKDKYANQLVSHNQAYATIIGYPYANFYDNFLIADPIQVLAVDKKLLQVIPQVWEAYIAPIQMSQTPLKIPAGEHQLIIAGVGFENSAKYTQLPMINFEQNKTYVVKPIEFSKKSGKVAVYEYEFDSRFLIGDKDSIILGKPVSEPVVVGNTVLFSN